MNILIRNPDSILLQSAHTGLYGHPIMPEIFFLLFAALVAAVLVYGLFSAQRRRDALRALAKELGLSFSEADPLSGNSEGQGLLAGIFGFGGRPGIPERFASFGALSAGHARKGYNVLHGSRGGRMIMAFDYRYTTGSGKNRHTHHLSAVVLSVEGRFPELVIRPENLLDKLAAIVGMDDIDFESHEFSRRFCVKSRDRKLAYDIVDARMMDYLLSGPGWSLELDGPDLMICNSVVFSPQDFRAAIAFAEGFLERIPGFVWKDRGGPGAKGGGYPE